jgi:hypothetical protein
MAKTTLDDNLVAMLHEALALDEGLSGEESGAGLAGKLGMRANPGLVLQLEKETAVVSDVRCTFLLQRKQWM